MGEWVGGWVGGSVGRGDGGGGGGVAAVVLAVALIYRWRTRAWLQTLDVADRPSGWWGYFVD